MLVKLPKNLFTILGLIILTTIVVLDFFSPTLIILTILLISIIFKRFKFSSLGFKKISSPFKILFLVLGTTLLLQLVDIGILMPILNRLTGTHIDYSNFEGLSGNISKLITFLVLSWTFAAIGEEIIYRGYIFQLLVKVFQKSNYLPILLSSLIFALAHIEQGIIGVLVSGFDGLIFCLLKRKFNNNLWVSILAHGLYNTIGVVVFYFTGPIYQLW